MTGNKLNLDHLKDTIQDANINFLLGSGLSMPHLQTLGNIEVLLTELEGRTDISDARKKVLYVALLKRFYEVVILKNLEVLEGTGDSEAVLAHYSQFLQLVNSILLNRKTSIISKQVNVYTTNVDVYLEKALDAVGLEYNDGFSGRLSPIFSLSNFRKSSFKKSLHFDNTSEIPVFNLLKLHGSLTWEIRGNIEDSEIYFSPNLDLVRKLQSADFSDIESAGEANDINALNSSIGNKRTTESIRQFEELYLQLPIVNPTKDKFRMTLLNRNYYELLRMYANGLEKENSVLFVMGFSFADEHIREVTLRAADSNPTLTIFVFAYSSKAKEEIEERLDIEHVKNSNIKVIGPSVTPGEEGEESADDFKYDLETINKMVFEKIFSSLNSKAS